MRGIGLTREKVLEEAGVLANEQGLHAVTITNLAKHLGIAHSTLDSRICELLQIAEDNGHSLETEFRDMSDLDRYIRKR